MNSNLKTPLILLSIALACTAPLLAQGGGRGRGANAASGGPPQVQLLGGRFKAYPADAADRGLPLYNTTCGYCHGERGKGGNSGPDLITSDVTLHDEDGVGMGDYLKGAKHQGVAKLDLPQTTIYDIAVYLHSRVNVAALNRGGDVHPDEVLKAGNADAGKAYFNGAGGCTKCHSVDGNLKGVGAKYDAATLQDRLVMPQRGGGRGGRGAPVVVTPNPLAITATVTLPNGQTFKGLPLRVTDFDVTLRLDDGSTQTWARNNDIPKVELTDPLAGHVELMKKLKDSDMHNLTAYLATLK
jgi:mono/diheme cytochrome c family protein